MSFPHDENGPWFPGTLIAWRWVNQQNGTWTALVSYTRGSGLRHEHWIDGRYLRFPDRDHPQPN